MEREALLSELKELSLYDLLEVYVEAKKGCYKDLEAELSVGVIDLIHELEQHITGIKE